VRWDPTENCTISITEKIYRVIFLNENPMNIMYEGRAGGENPEQCE
jgi:hypothetical protein